MSIFRIPLIVIAAVCMHTSATPPQAPASQEDRERVPPNLIERIARASLQWPIANALTIQKAGVWIPGLIESAVVLSNSGLLPDEWSDAVLRLFTGFADRNTVAYTLSPLMVAGATFAIAGTAFRLSAYRTLGRHFTFELALLQSHRLVTAYPYNIVRHPSYTGYLATMAGASLVLSTRDGWMRAALFPWLASAHATPAKMAVAGLGALGVAMYTFVTVMFFSRMGAEDKMLRKRFGAQWDAWASRVSYKIVPFVF